MNRYMALVKRGAKLLDKRVPDWKNRICISDLNITNSTSCIFGQVFANASMEDGSDVSPYSYGRLVLLFDMKGESLCKFGFDPDDDDENLDTQLLTNTWIEYIVLARNNCNV